MFSSARLSRAFGWALLPVPIAGWIVAQSFVDRIARFAEWTAAYVHTLIVSTFAVLLLTSAIVNLCLLTRRLPDRSPRSGTRYALAQSAVIASALAWLVCLAIDPLGSIAETMLGALVSFASTATFVLLLVPDPLADHRRHVRIAQRRASRTPRQRLRRKLLAIGTAAALVIGVTILQLVPIHSPECEAIGMGNFNGVIDLYTSCGDMTVDSSRLAEEDVAAAFHSGRDLDLTTRGFAFGIPPRRVLVEIGYSKDG